MTELLCKLFVKEKDHTEDPKVRFSYGKMAGFVGLFCNLLLFAGKLSAGLIFGSVAISADAVNNLSDASSSIVTLLGFKMSEKPADKEHPFGHARFEYLSGLIVAIMIMLIGVELVKTSLNKILHPTPVTFSFLSVAVLLASMGVKLWMAFFNRRIGQRIGSPTLEATYADSRNDVFTTGAVLAATLLSHFTSWNLDGYMGLAVAVFILISGIGIIKDTINPLLGEAPTQELSRKMAETILGYQGVLGVHDLVVHDYGPGRRFASVHVEMSASADPLASHDVIDNIERHFHQAENIDLVIHYDPVVTDDDAINAMHSRILAILNEISPHLAMHDFRMVRGVSHTNLIFDVVIPQDIGMSCEEIKRRIDEQLQTPEHIYYTVITFDANYTTLPTADQLREKIKKSKRKEK